MTEPFTLTIETPRIALDLLADQLHQWHRCLRRAGAPDWRVVGLSYDGRRAVVVIEPEAGR
ncbi:MAG TPA: hypothetical protein VEI97_09765 [bacterium]|nr:hypothetical protein [bacterium]